MKHTKEEILNALGVIMDVCKEPGEQLEGCSSCPFFVNEECMIMCREPESWSLNDKGAIWRAFK